MTNQELRKEINELSRQTRRGYAFYRMVELAGSEKLEVVLSELKSYLKERDLEYLRNNSYNPYRVSLNPISSNDYARIEESKIRRNEYE